jgi:hypothetical protein
MGLSLITLPDATVLLEAVVTVPSTKPAPVIEVVAAACVAPTTLGTATLAGPLEITKLTDEPTLTLVPAVGLSLITLPAATVLLDAVVTVPSTKPAPVMAEVATACVSPTTFGTDTCAGPLDTTKLTDEPTLTLVPAVGLSLITLPEATVLLEAVVTVPTTKPAPVMDVVAAACVAPTTLGTATLAGPLETTKLTAEPTLTLVPAVGLSLITLPAATVLLDAVVTVPTTKPAPVIAVVAAACESPTTFGTDTCAGPLDTTKLTDEPTLTLVPAVGLSLITLPEATVLLDAVVTVPTIKPAPVIEVVAAACVAPTTLGTATLAGPLETTRFTDEPTLTLVPAVGLSLMTLPAATVLLEVVVTVPTTKLAPVMAEVATACVSPTTFGTDTCAGPLDTTKLTDEPALTLVPAVGLSLITLPKATVLLDAVVTVPSTKPAPVIDVVAAACVAPTTLGTATLAGPLEITKLTDEPTLTLVPEVGLSLITLPAATVLLDAVVTVPTTKPAPVIDVVAAACVAPTTLGTATLAGPLETTRFTAEPRFTPVPAIGFSLMTSPVATVLLEVVVTVPTTKLAPVMAEVATACVSPTTFGTDTCAGPLDTTKLTDEPALTLVPAVGLSLITLPEATVLLEAIVTVPTTKPAPVMDVVAAACVAPTTLGTATLAGPLETTKLTAEPTLTLVPAVGLSLITLPAATVLLDAVVTVPTTKPAPVIAVVAAACESPTTFGTDTCAGPLDTTKLTDEPTLTLVPAVGLSLITLPEATVLLDAVVTVPTIKPAPVIEVVAAACVAPTTLGTATLAGPLETTRFTDEPTLTLVPAVGLSLMTLPAATVLLEVVVTVPTTKLAPVMAEVATACVSPTTFGTDACAGPLDTTKLTDEPALTLVPAVGLSLITLPEATVLLDAVVTVPSTKPAPVMAVVAAACVLPTTFGTDTWAGPVDTTIFTAEPVFTPVPAVGVSLITLPAATVLLEAVVTVPSTKPAPVMAVVAAACVLPTTFGTATVACCTVNPPTRVAISPPVVTVTVRGPGAALAATVNDTDKLVRLAAVGVPTVIPDPAVTWLKPVRKLL